MPLVLNEEQTLLKSTAEDFFRRQAPVSALRALRDSGMTGAEAIKHYIAVERGEAPLIRTGATGGMSGRTGTGR